MVRVNGQTVIVLPLPVAWSLALEENKIEGEGNGKGVFPLEPVFFKRAGLTFVPSQRCAMIAHF
jgi:hypothetical protein